MKTKRLICSTLPLVLLLGCATSNREQGVAYRGTEGATPAPTSNRDQTRIYSDAGTAGKMQASPQDIQVGAEVRQLLMDNKKLAPPPSNLTATAHDGVVTLCGTIPTRRNEEELRDQIAQLPGVTRVDDQLRTR